MRERRSGKVDNRGFTLVELIVVLVILAILAAILVPALLGYIDSARDKQYMLNARNCITAAQAQLIELYGTSGGTVAEGEYVIAGGRKTSAKNGDSDITNTAFAQKVLSIPYFTRFIWKPNPHRRFIIITVNGRRRIRELQVLRLQQKFFQSIM